MLRFKAPKILFAISILVCTIFSASAQSEYHQTLSEIAGQHNLIGTATVVTCGPNILDEYYFGTANISQDLAYTSDTKVRIASVSKYVSATGLLKLYEQGEFELDQDVSEALGFDFRNPDFPNQAITYRMLLSHQSSLQDGSGYANFLTATLNGGSIPSLSDLVSPSGAHYTADMWRTEQPGSHFQYSNANFVVVATLIEAHSNQRFDEFMKAHILEPLGITGSFNIYDLENLENLAPCYRNSNPQVDGFNGNLPDQIDLSGYEIGTNGALFAPQGGLRATAEELSRFLRMHLNYGTFEGNQILDSTTVALMHSPEWSYDGSNGNNYYNLFNEWGLGVQRTTNAANGDVVIPNRTFYGHAGEAYGLISDVYFERETGLGIVFLTNGYTGASNYSFGSESAFYQPEEETYQAIATHWADICLAQHNNIVEQVSQKPIFYHDSLNQSLVLDQRALGGKICVSNATGGKLIEKYIESTNLELNSLLAGIYIVEVLWEGQSFTQKIYIER